MTDNGPNLSDQIERAVLEGLGWREGALTAAAKKQLATCVTELAGVRDLELDVCRRARELWQRLDEKSSLDPRLLPLVYPRLDAEWRILSAREQRKDAEERETWARLGYTPPWLEEKSD